MCILGLRYIDTFFKKQTYTKSMDPFGSCDSIGWWIQPYCFIICDRCMIEVVDNAFVWLLRLNFCSCCCNSTSLSIDWGHGLVNFTDWLRFFFSSLLCSFLLCASLPLFAYVSIDVRRNIICFLSCLLVDYLWAWRRNILCSTFKGFDIVKKIFWTT